MPAKGSKETLRALFDLKASGTVTIAGGGLAQIAVETIDGDTHSHYTVSLYHESATVVTYQTADPGQTQVQIEAAIAKRRTSVAPKQVIVELHIKNWAAGSREVAYEVFRIAGLGEALNRA